MKGQALRAPDWFAKGAMYQINPRTFSAEGTIAAVTKELPWLAEMGFSTMYLCPVFEEDDSDDLSAWSERQKKSGTGNPKNPYRMMDYFNIDSEYGTERDLADFIREAHRLGMRVLLDLVYYHMGPNAYILQTHPEFAQHDENGNVIYGGWHFPILNYESEGLREYLWSNMAYYIGKLDADGFRCDVGDMVPLDFWIEGRRRIQKIKPDAVLLNEGSRFYYMEEGFDACYAFAWHETVYRVFRGEKTALDMRETYDKAAANLPKGGLLMRDMDNHDTVTDWPERAELAAGHDGMDLIEAMNFTLDGIPMVYCGNELADTTTLSMFSNRFHRGSFQATDREAIRVTETSKARQNLIRTLNGMRRESDLLARGETEWIDTENPEKIIAFRRKLNGESVLFIGNVSKAAVTVKFDAVEELAVLAENCEKTPDGFALAGHGWGIFKA